MKNNLSKIALVCLMMLGHSLGSKAKQSKQMHSSGYVLKVVGSNPSTVYWMDIFDIYLL